MTLAVVVLAVVVVAQLVAGIVERRWWANRVIARHAPDLAAIERPATRRHRKEPVGEPPRVPRTLAEMAD